MLYRVIGLRNRHGYIPINPDDPFFAFLFDWGYTLLFFIIPAIIGLIFFRSKLMYSAMLTAGILLLLLEKEIIGFIIFTVLFIIAGIIFGILFLKQHKKYYSEDNEENI